MVKKWLSLAVKFAVSGALIWFLFSKIDVSEVADRLLAVDPWLLVAAVGIYTFQIGVCGFRWKAVLSAINSPLPFWPAVRLFYIGAFFNQTLPSAVGGDAVRMYLARKGGLSLGGAVNGVMLERVATVAALGLMVLAVQPLFLPKLDPAAAKWVLTSVLAFVAIMAGGIVFVALLDRLPESLHRWKLVRGLVVLASDTRKVFMRPGNALRAIGWSLAGHVNVTIGIWVLAQGLGIEVTLVDCLALFPPVILITTLPISIAGWGVREQAMVTAFGLIAIPADAALALSLLFGLVVVVTSLPGGLVWLLSGERKAKVEQAMAAETAN